MQRIILLQPEFFNNLLSRKIKDFSVCGPVFHKASKNEICRYLLFAIVTNSGRGQDDFMWLQVIVAGLTVLTPTTLSTDCGKYSARFSHSG